MPEMLHKIKDSVFSYLFRQPEYTRELYVALHPEDADVTETDCKVITLENILTTGLYNDLGIQIRDRLILLAEAQSTFSVNITLRMLLYLAETYKEFVEENNLRLYSTGPVKIPRPELYVIYTGDQENVPDALYLSDLYEGDGSVNLAVKVLRGSNKGDVVSQYVRFCQIAAAMRKIYGKTEEAVRQTIAQCLEENVLTSFLTSRMKEVESIMITLFDQEKIWDMDLKDAKQEGFLMGRAEGISQGRAEGISQGRAEGISQGRAEGISQGRAEGMQTLVSSLKSFGIGKKEIAEQLVTKYSLSASEAVKIVEQYWSD